MIRRRTLALRVGILAALGFLTPNASADKTQPKPPSVLRKELMALPYGISGQQALLVRTPAIESLQFFGQTADEPLINMAIDGVWEKGLRVVVWNRSHPGRITGSFRFIEPVDLTRFNSLVVYVRTDAPGLRFRAGLERPSVRTKLVSLDSLPLDTVGQIVIPFNLIFSKTPLNYSEIRHVVLEFRPGPKAIHRRAWLEIIGVAFVRQTEPPATVTLVYRPNGGEAHIQSLDGLRWKPSPAVLPPSEPETQVIEDPVEAQTATAVPAAAVPETPALEGETGKIPLAGVWDWFGGLTFLCGLLLVVSSWVWFRRRLEGRRGVDSPFLGKVLLKINPKTAPVKEWWKLPARDKSSSGVIEEGPSAAELERQIALGHRNGVTLIPTLGFFKAVFNYDEFLAHPYRFRFRIPSPAADRMNDDTLRRHEPDAFPLWIPAPARKKYSLPKRVLVEYARNPAGTLEKDYIQFNLGAPILKKLATGSLGRLSRLSSGVRIANAVDAEFWPEVIEAVKSKRPGFIFIADRDADRMNTLREAGFDFIENETVRDALAAQVRAGTVGGLLNVLAGERASHLPFSIFDISKLLAAAESTHKNQKSQNLLSAALLCLFPGMVAHTGEVSPDFEKFLNRASGSPPLHHGMFISLSTSHPELFAFARWDGKDLAVVIANFSLIDIQGVVRLEALPDLFNENKLYLLNNMFHGLPSLKNILNPLWPEGPALALWGQVLQDAGLPVKMKGLSVNVLTMPLEKILSGQTLKQESIPTYVK